MGENTGFMHYRSVTKLLVLISVCITVYAIGAQAQAPAPAVPETVAPGSNVVVITEDQISKLPKRKDDAYEDWSKPELPSGMRSETDVIGEFEDAAFRRELVHAQWRDLDPIDLVVVKPVGVAKPPVILYLYSFPSSLERYKDASFCDFLTKNGYAAVGFVLAVTDQRFHDRPQNQWFVSQLQEAMGTSTHDVQMILNYLAQRGDMDMTRVGMWGDGAGASVAIMASAVDPRIKALDLLDPWGDWPDWLAKSSLTANKPREDYLKPEFLASVEDLDPVKWLPSVKAQEVRLQYITGDLTITPPVVREHLESVAPKNVKVVHYDSLEAFRKDVGSTGKGFDWIKQQLEPVPQKRAQNAAKSSFAAKNSEQ
jgi:hypothetical protein